MPWRDKTHTDEVISFRENDVDATISDYVDDVDYLVLKPTESYTVGMVDNLSSKMTVSLFRHRETDK